ncbi:MAG: hypothetical protein K2X09_02340 [Rickettsiales bacterium]|nr:hypothetical protein [Rickettsiales bacterium]
MGKDRTTGEAEMQERIDELKLKTAGNERRAAAMKKSGAVSLLVELELYKGIESPVDTRNAMVRELVDVAQTTFNTSLVPTAQGDKKIKVTEAIADRAVDTHFKTSFNDDLYEAGAIAAGVETYKALKQSSWFGVDEKTLLQKTEIAAAQFLNDRGIKASPSDLAKIAIESMHHATGTEGQHRPAPLAR